MSVRPDPLNLARWLRTVSAGAASYVESFNPLHLTRGAWGYRIFADRPMDSVNYGASSRFKRLDSGGNHVCVHEATFEGISPPSDQLVVTLDAQSASDRVVVNNTSGVGTTTVLQQVADPGGSGRRVWLGQWDCTTLWGQPDSGDAVDETTTGRRRNELRQSVQSLYPYGTELWAITSVYLDPAVAWESMTAGDYIHTYQWHDTSLNGSNKPGLAGYICAPRSTRSGDYPDPPSKWFLLHELLNSEQVAIARWTLQEPPTGKWLYTVTHLTEGGSSPFVKVWHVEEGKAPVLAIDYQGEWGYINDAGIEYAKAGPYSPGSYQGTVPVRRYWFDGLALVPATEVPGMTPERMVAALIEQPRY